MSSSSEEDVLLPTDTDSKEATNTVAAAGGNVKKFISQQHCGMFTAIEDLLVAKAYIKASENVITGNKQKLVMFYTHHDIALYMMLLKRNRKKKKSERQRNHCI